MKHFTNISKFNEIDTTALISIKHRLLQPAGLRMWLPGLALILATLVSALPALAMDAPYLDETGAQQTATNVTALTGNETTLASGWYLAGGSLNYQGTLTVSGDVVLILADDSDLVVNGNTDADDGRIGDAGIDVSTGNSLTVYAQSTGNDMGRLTASGGSAGGAGIGGAGDLIGGAGGTITIDGGAITATGGGMGGAGIGGGGDFIGGAGGAITINGGSITATGGGVGGAGIGGGGGLGLSGSTGVDGTIKFNGGGGVGGIITINGGTVVANGGSTGIGGGSFCVTPPPPPSPGGGHY